MSGFPHVDPSHLGILNYVAEIGLSICEVAVAVDARGSRESCLICEAK